MGKEEQPPKSPVLRPRWSAWRLVLGMLLLWCVLTSLGAPQKPDTPLKLCLMVTLALSCLALYSWYERRRRPSLLWLWVDESGVELQVRKVRTGEVLLESERATLRQQDLTGWALPGAVLSGIDLGKAKLEGADLRGAQFRNSQLVAATLAGADLRGANLEYANLTAADLRRADLRGARLAAASLAQADLRGADLRGADLAGHGANRVLWERRIGSAQFEGAVYDETTRWPPGFNPRWKSCIFVKGSTTRLPIPAATADVRLEQLPAPAAALQAVSAEAMPVEQASQLPNRG